MKTLFIGIYPSKSGGIAYINANNGRAACWNLLWALQQRTTHPELNDVPWADRSGMKELYRNAPKGVE